MSFYVSRQLYFLFDLLDSRRKDFYAGGHKEENMQALIQPAQLGGRVRIPGSKSHTIRALLCAFCADGESVIASPCIPAMPVQPWA
jgi:hypothetical protein